MINDLYSSNVDTEMVEIFCRYIRRNGKIIYPKNAKYFHFWIKKKAKTN